MAGSEVRESELWATVLGQPTAVRFLQAAAANPLHAYLFVGPEGSGRAEAVRAFAGSLFGIGGCDEHADRHRRLAAAGTHPDLVFVEPEGRSLLIADTRRVVTEGFRSPIEAARKVIVVDRFDTAEPEAAASLLKTVEEPPPTVILVLLTAEVSEPHATIASRCVRVDFPRLGDELICGVLISDGVDPERVEMLAKAAAGSVARARLLAEDPEFVARREAWNLVPDRLDGTGAAVVTLVAELQALIDGSQSPLTVRHENELAAVEQQEEAFGTRGAGRRNLVERHRREVRRLRDDELRFGLATLSRRYRDSIAGSENGPCLDATARITAAAGELARNPNERLLLQALFLDLPGL